MNTAGFAAYTVPLLTSLLWTTQVDLYDPASGAYLGSETTLFAPDGRRFRQTNRNASGETELEFILLHDANGREREAWFWEGDSEVPWQETFTYSADGRQQTITYFTAERTAADVTVVVLDEQGREAAKSFYRADGTQYGAETVLWNADGTRAGWDFRYLTREGGASFRYDYLQASDGEHWRVRTRSRDNQVERLEVRSDQRNEQANALPTPTPFLPGLITTGANESSPSFTDDAQTMVFARYEDWARKRAYIARRSDGGWAVRELSEIGSVYNLSISGDGKSLLVAESDEGPLKRYEEDGGEWQLASNLTEALGVQGGYGHLGGDGTLRYYAPEGPAGAGIYMIDLSDAGDTNPRAVITPAKGTAFDAFEDPGGKVYYTYCFTDSCDPVEGNGVYRLDESGGTGQQLAQFGYVWGVQPIPALGIWVFTDGEDILALPLTPSEDFGEAQ